MLANGVDRKTTLAGFEPAILGSSQAAGLARRPCKNPMPYPFGHRVIQANGVDGKTTLAGFEPAILGSSQVAALAERGRSHVRIQRLLHLATGSSATIVRKTYGTLTDLGSGCMESENEGREIRTPKLLIWSQTRCRCAIPR